MVFGAWFQIGISLKPQRKTELHILQNMYVGITEFRQVGAKNININVVMLERYPSTPIIAHVIDFYSIMKLDKIRFGETFVFFVQVQIGG